MFAAAIPGVEIVHAALPGDYFYFGMAVLILGALIVSGVFIVIMFHDTKTNGDSQDETEIADKDGALHPESGRGSDHLSPRVLSAVIITGVALVITGLCTMLLSIMDAKKGAQEATVVALEQEYGIDLPHRASIIPRSVPHDTTRHTLYDLLDDNDHIYPTVVVIREDDRVRLSVPERQGSDQLVDLNTLDR